MSKEHAQKVFSGDQSLFSSWDSMVKLSGYKKYESTPVVHQFHLADTMGKGNREDNSLHLTNEAFRYREGREVQPAWFAVTEMWPAFPIMPTVPYKIGLHIGEKFESFAQNTAQFLHSLSEDERKEAAEVMKKIGFPHPLPLDTDGIYEIFTSSSSYGIADEGKRSGSNYNFSEIEDLQKRSLLKLYKMASSMVPQEKREGVKTRFLELASEEGDFYPLVAGKMFPEMAQAVYDKASEHYQRITGIEMDNIQTDNTVNYFRLIDSKGTLADNANQEFKFLNWYLRNRELFNTAHNEVSEELSQKGENPIQSLSAQKGETPFWVIIGDDKYKLYLPENEIKIVKRDGDQVIEKAFPIEYSVQNHEDLGNLFKEHFKEKDITIIPTALGLALQLRSTGDLLLPEHGSSYVPQLNKLAERMSLVAGKKQMEDLLPQFDIVRVHPHAISSLPDNEQLRLPWHVRDYFPQNEKGLTKTTDIKENWQEVVENSRDILQKVAASQSLIQKADVLFSETQIQPLQVAINGLKSIYSQENEVKPLTSRVLDTVKSALQPNEIKKLGQISSFVKAQTDSLPDGLNLSSEVTKQIYSLRSIYQELTLNSEYKNKEEQLLKFFVALKVRQLDACAESLEYFDARPSSMTQYMLFGEEGIKKISEGTEITVEKTPSPIEKRWYDAEGNKIMVVLDEFGQNSTKKKKVAAHLASNLAEDSFDTAMVLSPTDTEDVDFIVDQVCMDGSTGGMCGNGLRAIGKFAYDKWGLQTVKLKTHEGERVEAFYDGESYGGKLHITRLSPETKSRFKNILPEKACQDDIVVESIPHLAQDAIDKITTKGVNAFANRLVLASGEPHMVIELLMSHTTDSREETLKTIASAINSIKYSKKDLIFPNEINVTFLEKTEAGYKVTTHERGGPGLTGACGTGAVSAMSLLTEQGHFEVDFRTPSGNLAVTFNDESYVVKGRVEEIT